MRRGSIRWIQRFRNKVSILPRLATGIVKNIVRRHKQTFLFFPVLRRGSGVSSPSMVSCSFYSSPSCDGDRPTVRTSMDRTGFYSSPSCDGDLCITFYRSNQCVSILPRLATGIKVRRLYMDAFGFYSSPSCDGDQRGYRHRILSRVSILPRLATGIKRSLILHINLQCFYSSPSCDGDPASHPYISGLRCPVGSSDPGSRCTLSRSRPYTRA